MIRFRFPSEYRLFSSGGDVADGYGLRRHLKTCRRRRSTRRASSSVVFLSPCNWKTWIIVTCITLKTLPIGSFWRRSQVHSVMWPQSTHRLRCFSSISILFFSFPSVLACSTISLAILKSAPFSFFSNLGLPRLQHSHRIVQVFCYLFDSLLFLWSILVKQIILLQDFPSFGQQQLPCIRVFPQSIPQISLAQNEEISVSNGTDIGCSTVSVLTSCHNHICC